MARSLDSEFKKALEKRRILRFSQGKRLVKKELRAASEDLAEARDRHKNERYKYSPLSRASLFAAPSQGVREVSHDGRV